MNITNLRAIISATVLCIILQACTGIKLKPAEAMQGTWTSAVGGFPVTSIYDASSVKIGDNEAVSYHLEGDILSFPESGVQSLAVSFNGQNEMIQTDLITGTHQVLKRVLDN